LLAKLDVGDRGCQSGWILRGGLGPRHDPAASERSVSMPERKSLRLIPKFESEDEEREFWATHDSTEHVD